VQATHIQPWFKGGADVARNGLPLSGTISWMFRRGLITLTNDLEIIRARALPKQLEALLPYNRAFGETIPKFKPHPSYLEFHREHIFERGQVGDSAVALSSISAPMDYSLTDALL
jgi:putative restriction endonuclease